MQAEPWLSIVVYAVGVLLPIGIAELAMRARRKQRLVDDVPTCKASGVFIGLVELKGTAESEDPLTSQLGGTRCVHYRYRVEEHWRRTTTETYTDGKGGTKTRTKTESGWTTVDHGEAEPPFYLRDDTGVVRIVPHGADVSGDVTFSERCGREDPLYYEKGPRAAIAHSTHRRRFTEWSVPLHAPIYVIGRSRIREDVVAAEIADDDYAPLFEISMGGERHVSLKFQLSFWIGSAAGLVLAALVPFIAEKILLAPDPERFPMVATFYAGSGYIGYWLLRWSVMVFNSLTALRHRVTQARENVEIELKRRADLIPRLARATQALAAHDKDLQAHLAELRGKVEEHSLERARAAVPVLRAVVEAYPMIAAQSGFRGFLDALTETENRIALARGFYNDSVSEQNERGQRFPDRLLAPLARLDRRAYIGTNDFERAPVPVTLSD
jgi:hypothetical protein